jgi:pectate lyase
VDGDQITIKPSHKVPLMSRFGEIHIFKNHFSDTQRANYTLGWCHEHVLTKEASIKEAVDHAVTFYCGENYQNWMNLRAQITIVSKDKSFRNVQNFLQDKGIPCYLRGGLPNIYDGFKRMV